MIFGQFVLGIHFTANANGNFSGPMLGRIVDLLELTFSLVGEELITAAVAFPLYHLASKKLPAQWAWVVASVVSSLLFGLMHFKIYHGNLYQCLVVIGLTRLPFNYAWRKADSLWAGIIVHIIYDWIIFVPAMLTG